VPYRPDRTHNVVRNQQWHVRILAFEQL
jgi:hypothetical protein